MSSKIAVIGAGSYGTALALVLARSGHTVSLRAHDPAVAKKILETRQNQDYLPGFDLPSNIQPTPQLEEALKDAEFVVLAVPSHVAREVYGEMLPFLSPSMIFVSATKGIEVGSLMRMEEVAHEVLGPRFQPRYVALSGPSFAVEVAKDHPSAIVAASKDAEAAVAVQRTFSSRTFRVYTNSDVIGVEIGGAVKNVMAIATGVVNGLGLGYNSVTALITRGLAEMTRLAVGLGGRSETLAGLAGMGDLVLTCLGNLSRNRQLGYELGQGRKLEDILGGTRQIAEGVRTAQATHGMMAVNNIDMPISEGVYQMLYEGKTPRELLSELMERPLKGE